MVSWTFGKGVVAFVLVGSAGYIGYELFGAHPFHKTKVLSKWTHDQYHDIKCATLDISKGWNGASQSSGPDVLDCGFQCPRATQ
ncbi:hypothetical protein MHLP_01555 [Candidatus Mycoplasma haematolamae str. Purdue]|uniref:Uncharacterized protein n=1 Tax=Mycoplasma haematolamae (strain Purdue) TaxID=1212765 RepID=I7CF64_MYCHA|nr:hypothetical protein [Candidatus Mycoplasma haematolamae]AFO51891.1 hypothetical protein MHLP_01555 [Candidatus Mycoplasma haematolamae str. Purdue]